MEGSYRTRLIESEGDSTDPAIAEAVGHSTLLAEAEDGEGGNVFKVMVIQPGVSKNRRRYRREVLEASAPLLDGARSFASEDLDHDPRRRGVKSLVGWWSNPAYETNVELPNGKVAEGITADYHVTDTGLARTLRESIRGGKPDLITFSIVADGEVQVVPEATGRRSLVDVKRITAYESVDPVINAAAGGMAVRLVASVEDPSMDWATLTLAEAVSKIAKGEITFDEVKENRSDLAAVIESGKIAEATPAPAPVAEPAPAPAPAPVAPAIDPEQVRRLTESVAIMETQERVSAALAAHPNLPASVRERVRESASARRITLGRSLTEAEVGEIVKREKDYLAALNPASVKDAGAPLTRDMKSEQERVTEALYDMISGKSNDSIKAMYLDLTGDRSFTGKVQESGRLSESITTATFDQIMGDSITRRMLDIYHLPDLETWRPLVQTVPLNDFRTQRRIRLGGYGNLPAVAAAASYTALTSPSDEEATYSISKRGGTEDITMETIVNDDLGAIRQVPVRLGRAASQTLHEFVFDFLATNPSIYDALALFHASHNNLGSTALSASSLLAGRAAMLKQTDMSSGKRLQIAPKTLVVPIDLEQTAYELTQTGTEPYTANNTVNFVRTMGLNVITVGYWTDTNNWFLVADQSLVPTIEIGFLNGREDPELFLQDQPTVGNVFSNDKLTYKIRHIYGGGVLDYRGFYGAIV